eukprot:gene25780-11448_t
MGTPNAAYMSPHQAEGDVDSPITNLPPLPVMSLNDNWYNCGANTPREFGTPGQSGWQGLMSPTAWEPKGLNWDTKNGPITFTVSDRQVYVPDESAPPSLYTMLRSWVQNETEPQPRPPEQAPLQLEKLPPAEPESTAAPAHAPAYSDESESLETEERMSSLKSHWRAVRLHHQGIRKQKLERHRIRLAALIANTGNTKQQEQHELQGHSQLQANPNQAVSCTERGCTADRRIVTLPQSAGPNYVYFRGQSWCSIRRKKTKNQF